MVSRQIGIRADLRGVPLRSPRNGKANAGIWKHGLDGTCKNALAYRDYGRSLGVDQCSTSLRGLIIRC